MNQIGIISALPAEARYLSKSKIPLEEPCRINDFITVYICGMGSKRAEHAAEILINDSGVQGLISWGTAGALSNDLIAGDMVLPEKIIYKDSSFESDLSWLTIISEKLKATPVTIYHGTLASTDKILSTIADKHVIYNNTGAICVDMESAFIARMAHQYSIPFIAIRTIVDDYKSNIPKCITDSINEFGNIHVSGFLYAVIMHPGEILQIKSLYSGMQKATRSLKQTGSIINTLVS